MAQAIDLWVFLLQDKQYSGNAVFGVHSPWKLLPGFLRTPTVTVLFHLNACSTVFLPNGKSYHMQHPVTITCIITIHSAWSVLVCQSNLKTFGIAVKFSDQVDIIAGKKCWGLNEKCGVLWSPTCLTLRLADLNSLVSELPVLVIIYCCVCLACAHPEVQDLRDDGGNSPYTSTEKLCSL